MEEVLEEIAIEKYPAYKDSGVEWLGEIPEHWNAKRLKFVLSYQKGKNPKEIILDETEHIYLSMEFLRSKFQKIQYVKSARDLVMVNKDDMLLLWDGSNAGEFVKGKKGVLSSTMALIKINCANRNYAWHYSKIIEAQLRKSTIGMGIPHVSSEELKNLLFLIPPPEEQTQIAQFLDHKTDQIDTAIGIKEKQIELLNERRQIVIHNAVTRGLNPNAPMKDSGVEWIGEIPEHWTVTKAKYYSKVFVPERSKPELNIEKDGKPWVTTEHLRSSELFGKDVAFYVSEMAQRKAGSRIIKANSVIATCVGNFGIASKLNFDCIINQQVQGFTDLKINADYLTYLIGISEDYFKNNSTLTTIMYVSKDTFGCMPILLPNEDEQDAIVSYIKKASKSLATAISLKEKEIEKLKEYKATLINSAVTGKIKVGGV